jgi:hypothetical protein
VVARMKELPPGAEHSVPSTRPSNRESIVWGTVGLGGIIIVAASSQ